MRVWREGVFHSQEINPAHPPHPHAGVKTQDALAALREDKTFADLGKRFALHPNQITDWRWQLLENVANAFGGDGADADEPVDLQPLHAKIGQLMQENDLLKRALTKAELISAKRWSTVTIKCPSSVRRSCWA